MHAIHAGGPFHSLTERKERAAFIFALQESPIVRQARLQVIRSLTIAIDNQANTCGGDGSYRPNMRPNGLAFQNGPLGTRVGKRLASRGKAIDSRGN